MTEKEPKPGQKLEYHDGFCVSRMVFTENGVIIEPIAAEDFYKSEEEMKTAAEVEYEFRADFIALLKKYGAEVETKDHWRGYSECGEDIRVMVSTPAQYVDNECVQEGAEFNLGLYITPE